MTRILKLMPLASGPFCTERNHSSIYHGDLDSVCSDEGRQLTLQQCLAVTFMQLIEGFCFLM